MARPSLSRLFSSISELSITKRSFTSFGSESVTRFASNSAIRFLSSAAHQPQLNHEGKLNEEKPEAVKVENKEEEEEEEEAEEDGDDFVNKETGEIGGPRGPEPTRYGDWERNGRCSDF